MFNFGWAYTERHILLLFTAFFSSYQGSCKKGYLLLHNSNLALSLNDFYGSFSSDAKYLLFQIVGEITKIFSFTNKDFMSFMNFKNFLVFCFVALFLMCFSGPISTSYIKRTKGPISRELKTN